jgi:hypothetical protein
MKTKLLGLIGLIACAAPLGASQASASSITYNVDIVSAADSIQGTITTNGFIGALSNGQIQSWDLTVIDSVGSYVLAGPGLADSESSTIDGLQLIASPTELTFNFSDNTQKADFVIQAIDDKNGFILYDNTFGNSPPDEIDVLINSPYGVTASPMSDILGTAVTTTPLPAALPLFCAGLGVMGLLARRRKRIVAAE